MFISTAAVNEEMLRVCLERCNSDRIENFNFYLVCGIFNLFIFVDYILGTQQMDQWSNLFTMAIKISSVKKLMVLL